MSAVIAVPPPAWHRHEVRAELPEELPPIDADLMLMSRVLANLVDNGVRHSPPDAPIMISAAARAPDAIELSVTDRGPGVDPSRREEIFHLFARRADDAGAGLGLTIAKTFVEAQGEAHLGRGRPQRRRAVLLHTARGGTHHRGATACRKFSSLTMTGICSTCAASGCTPSGTTS